LSDRRDEFPHRFYGDADPQETITMSPTENKKLIQRYIQAVDDNQTSDWSILDEYSRRTSSRTIRQFPASAWTARE
jgi:hypothetical protein